MQSQTQKLTKGTEMQNLYVIFFVLLLTSCSSGHGYVVTGAQEKENNRFVEGSIRYERGNSQSGWAFDLTLIIPLCSV